ncbi:MAG: hypothetical protein AAF368_14010, partial [Planctomycetota bacterium]
LNRWLHTLVGGTGPRRNLNSDEAFQAFDRILSGAESEIAVTAFLVSLRWKGVTVEELIGFARAARARATLPCTGMPGLVTVSPPQDGVNTTPPLEVAASLIAAGAGARVLIISDRDVPPRRGLTSACALEGLGLEMTWDPAEAETWVAKSRFGCLSVAGMLPEIMMLRKVREEIGFRTPLSTVEKLISPPQGAVVVGAQGGPVLGMAVEVLQALGHPRAIAIQGLEGGVIPSIRKRTRGTEFTDDHLTPLSVEPEDFGLGGGDDPELPFFGPPEDGQGTGDNPQLVKACGQVTAAVLAGEQGPARNAALLGAALILKAAGRAMTLAEGVDAATSSLDSGAASGVVEHLKSL